MEPTISRLKLSQWLLICIALSTIGTILMLVAVTAFGDYRAGEFGHSLTNPYANVRLQFELSAIMLTFNLVANFLGAGVLIAFFALRRRLRGR